MGRFRDVLEPSRMPLKLKIVACRAKAIERLGRVSRKGRQAGRSINLRVVGSLDLIEAVPVVGIAVEVLEDASLGFVERWTPTL